jgi:hypothetical protein
MADNKSDQIARYIEYFFKNDLNSERLKELLKLISNDSHDIQKKIIELVFMFLFRQVY